jgi:acetyltransferase-like isoleucine patch superfamily enzyme
MSTQENRFMSWRDMVFTPLVSTTIIALAIFITWLLYQRFALDSFLCFVSFFIFQTLFTLIALKQLRIFLPMEEGVYNYQTHPIACFGWNLYGFLCITHLNLFYDKILLPIPFRKSFYQLMGAQVGEGIIPISGQLLDPHLITLGSNSHIGEDAMLTPHAVTSDNQLYIGKIAIGENAMIGAKSTIMPGVKIGDGAMVNAMSLVTMNTVIAANEIWGGIPARKLKVIEE